MKRFEAVGFDYGGVIKGRPNMGFRAAACELLGVTTEDYLEAYFRHNKKINLDNVTWPDLWTDVLTDLGQPEKVPDIMQLSKAIFGQPINQSMLDLADSIRERGTKVGLLSNNPASVGTEMREAGVDEHFDVFHVSGETGFMKPSPEAYEHFTRALGTTAASLVFIDDSESSLSSAEECGYTPVLFTTHEDLCTTLANLGIAHS